MLPSQSVIMHIKGVLLARLVVMVGGVPFLISGTLQWRIPFS
jgi:hypothetical protein